MVDYSKWDKLSLEISDDEEEKPSASVTRLQGKGRVTIGKGGVTIVDEPEEAEEEEKGQAAGKGQQRLIGPVQPARAVSPAPADAKERQPAALSEEMHRLLTENGKETDEYLWSQTRTEAVLRIKLPADVKGSQLDVKLVDGFLTVKRSGEPIFHKRLRYSVDLAADEDGASDWEVIDIPVLGQDCRYLCLTLRKRSAIPGATFWWNGVFEGDPEIDVTAIPGRSMGHVDAWQEAQRLFREKVKARQPIELHFDDNDAADEKEHEESGTDS